MKHYVARYNRLAYLWHEENGAARQLSSSRGFALSALADSAENRINTALATHNAWVFIPG